MREIKFRVWDNVDYMTSFTLQDLQNKKIQFTSDCPIMQYTGLKDKNGKEIYEGDIITGLTSYERSNDEYEWTKKDPCVVEFYADVSGFYPFTLNARWRCDVINIEIIGNIYENSELIKTLTI